MKKIIIPILLVVLSLNLTAQVKFVSNNKNDMKTIAETLISSANTAFTYDTTLTHNQYRYNIIYKGVDNTDYRLYLRIQIVYNGENKDLNISGTPEYRFASVSGKFVDLFPFWKSFINPSENPEELTKKSATFIKKDGLTFVFSKFGDNWSIQMK